MTSGTRATDELARLQGWYRAQCDGDWEHQFGIQIGTLDNPGWLVDIDLEDTALEGKSFAEVSIDRSDDDWMRCKVDGLVFKGRGGADNLHEIFRVFLDWAGDE